MLSLESSYQVLFPPCVRFYALVVKLLYYILNGTILF